MKSTEAPVVPMTLAQAAPISKSALFMSGVPESEHTTRAGRCPAFARRPMRDGTGNWGLPHQPPLRTRSVLRRRRTYGPAGGRSTRLEACQARASKGETDTSSVAGLCATVPTLSRDREIIVVVGLPLWNQRH